MTFPRVPQTVPSDNGLQISLMAKPSMAFGHLRSLILPIAFKEVRKSLCRNSSCSSERGPGSHSMESLTSPGSIMYIYKKGGAKEFQGCRLLAQLLWGFLFVSCPSRAALFYSSSGEMLSGPSG